MNQSILQGNEQYYRGESPDYFDRLSKGQSPEYIWIGCCDSRVPPEVISGQGPGRLFVYRNIANQCRLDDSNMLSGLQFAIEALGVKKIIVCGHSHCGGVAAAMSDEDFGLNDVISTVRALYQSHHPEISMIKCESDRIAALAKINVLKQMENIQSLGFISKRKIDISPLFYHIERGELSVIESAGNY